MDDSPKLEALYDEARAALAAREPQRAAELLKRILLVDEDYRDASRLLAQVVAQQRRRWYRDGRLWGAVGAVAVVGLAVLAWPGIRSALAPTGAVAEPTQPPSLPIEEQAVSPTPTETAAPTVTATPAPTSIPLAWFRLSTGQGFAREMITAIAVDPIDPDVLYVGSAGAGIYRSIDGGLSWAPTHRGLAQASVRSLLIDPQDPRILYADLQGSGVYKTTNGGESWMAANRGIEAHGPFTTLVLDPGDTQHLYYTDGGRLFQSFDAGSSWDADSSSVCPDQKRDLAVHPTDADILFAANGGGDACPAGVYWTVDGGRTWTLLQGHGQPVRQLTMDSEAGRILYADETWEVGGLLREGETWTGLAGITGGCGLVKINPRDASLVLCARWGATHPSDPGEVRRSMDGGQTWETVYRIEMGWTRAIEFPIHAPDTIFLGGGGFRISTDGGETWAERSDGLGATRLNLWLHPQDSSILYIEDGFCDLYRSSELGGHWDLISNMGCGLAFDADGQTLYRAEPHRLRRSPDRGNTWQVLDVPRIQGPYVQMDTHARQPGTLWSLYWTGTAFVSRDAGETWQDTGLEMGEVRLSFDHNRGEVAYAIGRNGPALRSDDSGQTWQICPPGGATVGPSEGPLAGSLMAVDPRDSDHLILATRGQGVLVSEDACVSWQPSNQGLENLFVNTVAIDPLNPDTIYAGTDGGAYVSFDGGEMWGEISEGLLGATVVYSIVVDPEGVVYATTPYGIFRLEAQ